MTHVVTVYVQVQVRTEHPSPVNAEHNAMNRVREAIRMSLVANKTDMNVTAAQWSRREP